jgi:hypothetical protein
MESNSEGTSNDSKSYRNGNKGNNHFEDDNEESE